MRARHITATLAGSVIVAIIGAASALAAPVTSEFTYQGRLTSGGVPLTGQYDLVFKLYDASVGGNQVGSDVVVNDEQVTGGLVSVALDFGAGAFDGDARWLQVQLRPGASGGAYTTLTPRQPLTVVPYALYSANGGLWEQTGSRLTNVGTSFVGVNRSTQVTGSEYFGIQAPVSGEAYGGMYIATDSVDGQPFYGYDTGDETAWTYLEGSTNKWHLYLGGHRLTVTGDGDVGIATTTPDARLEVIGGDGNGIEATSSAAFSYGVTALGLSAGVRGQSNSSGAAGVLGICNTSQGAGVEGSSTASGGGGVAGYANFGTGVYGSTSTGWGVYGSNGGSNTTGYAGYFNGRVNVAGTLSKSGGSFRIDHPLDPANKYLSHSFVESPDMMNIYNGVAQLDGDGVAVVTLPHYFETLNRDYRYQLTAIGAPGPNLYIAQEIEGNVFVIAGGEPRAKVSWQITGIRQDPYARANRIVVEEDKPADERGRYLHPELYGHDPAYRIGPVERVSTTESSAQEAPQAERH